MYHMTIWGYPAEKMKILWRGLLINVLHKLKKTTWSRQSFPWGMPRRASWPVWCSLILYMICCFWTVIWNHQSEIPCFALSWVQYQSTISTNLILQIRWAKNVWIVSIWSVSWSVISINVELLTKLPKLLFNGEHNSKTRNII
jgi:hypothetical protein